MFLVWFIPLAIVMAIGVWALYLVVRRGLPKISSRSVEDALADEHAEFEMKTTEMPQTEEPAYRKAA
jgi:hypothetical protein